MTGGEGGGEGEGGEGEENCYPLITSLLNEGAVIKRNMGSPLCQNWVNKNVLLYSILQVLEQIPFKSRVHNKKNSILQFFMS